MGVEKIHEWYRRAGGSTAGEFVPNKEMPSFPQQSCGSPATSQLHTAKTQPGLFPSTESTRIINMETGECLPQHNTVFHIG